MKKLLRSLLLAAVLTTVLCVGALAADGDPKSGVYNIAPAAGTTFTPLEVSSSSATINGTQVDDFYAEAAKFSLNVENLQAGEQYLLLVLKADANGSQPAMPGVGDIVYINQTTADATGTVSFKTVYPSTLSDGKYCVCVTGKDRPLAAGMAATFQYYQAYTLGDVNEDGTIDSVDALKILQNWVGKIDLKSNQKLAADVNKDNAIDSVDALKILQLWIGKISSFN